jgi:bromodomain-containing factor 1
VQQEEYVDFEMKRELAVKIVTFEGENLEEAINIIRRGRPDLLGVSFCAPSSLVILRD